MEHSSFDHAARMLADAARSRRTAFGTILLAALGGTVGRAVAPASGYAKRKKRRKKRRPSLQFAFVCPGPTAATALGSGDFRRAQVFAATRSGSLRQIRVGIVKNGGSTPGDFLVQLLTTIGAPAVPDHSPLAVIAATVIPDGAVPEGASTLVANFVGPQLVQGTEYATVVSRPGSDAFASQIHVTDECPGVLSDAFGTGPFSNTATFDSVVSVLVT
jgi:hypothetical protein